eukprot:CAMPEP_0197543762 /NCGR_PEP_ID=MMETSP1318-20131121/68415_1 /TAXON_ID=552666 /ORGANISM="Partenskyella glossopodia, Strain RCC365" /LENGTH=78 /DNA_ID=CAMNT_0043103123 /DNA_START=331 /DNA_END=567 /DNA_ORIENTATION=-
MATSASESANPAASFPKYCPGFARDSAAPPSGTAAAALTSAPSARKPARRRGRPSSTLCLKGPKSTVRIRLASIVTAE